MQAKNKYSRAMRDGFMVKPSKPQAIRSSELLLKNRQQSIKTKPSAGFCVSVIAIFTLLLLPAFVR
ncbi:hypothetical protein [Providencia manganoxydans]|uniref:hypothetical protein n=1 Tax=Providencia manganoxydans TaxID=2923283 RepID=UPI0034DD4042